MLSIGKNPNPNGEAQTMSQPDVTIIDEGTICLLRPETEAAQDWIDENIGPDNGFQPYYPTVVVEHRYVEDILCGMADAGLTIS